VLPVLALLAACCVLALAGVVLFEKIEGVFFFT